MRVNCGVCGGEPAAVLCCADEAALCSACDRRVHRANKLAGKHRRVALLQPSGGSPDDSTTGPLCDVCKERRGLVFCVEDRAILCADCDDPIHSANDLTAKHSRFLLVGAKLSTTALVDDQAPSSPADCGDGGVPAAVVCAQDDSTGRSKVIECGDSNGGGAMISDYLTNICPGWRVDDLLVEVEEPPFSAAAKPAGREEHVPSMDADLFDAVAGRPEKQRRASSWTSDPSFEEVPTATVAKQGRVRETYWNHTIDNDRDVFAVPVISPSPAKKARPSPYWCF